MEYIYFNKDVYIILFEKVRIMHIENEISIYDFVCAISEAVDFISPSMNNHHKMVSYISYRIAQEAKLPENEVQNIILASILHDIGAFSVEERIKSSIYESRAVEENHHALMGYKLLKCFEPLSNAANLIKHHHIHYGKSKLNVPIGSYIINLADSISVLFNEHREILEQAPTILAKISQRKDEFHPDLLTVFYELAKKEYFWLEAFYPSFGDNILKKMYFSKLIVDMDTLRSFAKLTAQIIDFRSRFTATHSSGVAAVAKSLTDISGYPVAVCKMMEIAGFLHDVGKLAVSNGILEKNGKLNSMEYNSIRKHTYYTYFILSRIKGLEHIASWAAYHHEREDGNGYPFHVKGEDFSHLARIMAVADIVTALTEDRPYRLGMNREKSTKILHDMADNGGVDKSIIKLVDENFFQINDVRIQAQQESKREYEAFYKTDRKDEKLKPSYSVPGQRVLIPATCAP